MNQTLRRSLDTFMGERIFIWLVAFLLDSNAVKHYFKRLSKLALMSFL